MSDSIFSVGHNVLLFKYVITALRGDCPFSGRTVCAFVFLKDHIYAGLPKQLKFELCGYLVLPPPAPNTRMFC